MSIILRFEVDKKLLLDLLVTGIEWSCTQGYWGQIEEYKWEDWYTPETENSLMEAANPSLSMTTVLCRIRDVGENVEEFDEDDEPISEWKDITLYDLEQALEWALMNYNHLFSHLDFDYDKSINVYVLNDVNYDALGADVMLQKIALGDVIYG